MIAFHCPHCEQEIQVQDDAAGRAGKCTGCGKPIRVPGAEPPAKDDDRVPCPHCAERVRMPPNAVGRVAKCPHCKCRVRFTETGMEPVEESPESQTEAAPAEQETPAESQPAAAVPATEAAAIQWHVHTHVGQRAGPMNEQELQAWVASRRLTPECLLWREGWEDWQQAGDLFPDLPAAIPPMPQDDPDGFLADLGEPAPAFQPAVAAAPAELTFAPTAQSKPTSTASGGELAGDRRLIASLTGTRPWAVLFAISAFVLGVLILVGLIYVISQMGGRIPGSLVPHLVVGFLQAAVYFTTGVLALMYNGRIGAFRRSASSARLTAALQTQRTFWAVLSIALTVAMLFAIYGLIQVIRIINALSEIEQSIYSS